MRWGRTDDHVTVSGTAARCRDRCSGGVGAVASDDVVVFDPRRHVRRGTARCTRWRPGAGLGKLLVSGRATSSSTRSELPRDSSSPGRRITPRCWGFQISITFGQPASWTCSPTQPYCACRSTSTATTNSHEHDDDRERAGQLAPALCRHAHPCLGCGAPSSRPAAQLRVHTVAGWPSTLQNCVVSYSACTGWPAAPDRILSVSGRFVMLNASSGAAQIRSPWAQISLARSFSAPRPPVRGRSS